MTELEKLKEQKKELELRIKALETDNICMSSMLLFRRNDDENTFMYQVSVKGNYKRNDYSKRGPDRQKEAKRWYPIVREKSPEEAVNTLKMIEKDIPIIIEEIERIIQRVKEKQKAAIRKE